MKCGYKCYTYIGVKAPNHSKELFKFAVIPVIFFEAVKLQLI